MIFFRIVVQRSYVGRYKKKSEGKFAFPTDPPPYVWGRLNNKNIKIHVVKSQDDVQKRLRCKFTGYLQ